MNNGRSQLNGMAGLGNSKAGYHVKTPLGFGAVTSVFADMSRYFSGTWFDGIISQDNLNKRAILWKHSLSGFSEQVIEQAMAEVIMRGDAAAPSLNTIRYLCQRLTDENNGGSSRQAAKVARDRAMQKVRDMGVIRG